MQPVAIRCVIPSRLGVHEPFALKVRVLGEAYRVPCEGNWNTHKPALRGPYNLNVARDIPYMDNCLPSWQGTLRVDGVGGFSGPDAIHFDGEHQGVFAGDTRPIGVFSGLQWTTPGMHFLRLIDPVSGVEAWSNPVYVTDEPPAVRLFWGDPHWQTFFSDGVRCPEELYAFARDEGFLDFGAITDHMEAVTDRQWDYFVAVTNDFNAPGQFATLVGQEWTKMHPGHRNIYYRGNGGPVLRSDRPDCDTLEKLWAKLDGVPALAIPHHPANVIMGVDWACGWNPRYEKAVEIYSVWGSSECPASAGNPRPLRHCQGEQPGRHVNDALRAGYRLSFVGGGDIHDGRPGDGLEHITPMYAGETYPQGFTAALAPTLTRESIFDAIATHQTYATTHSRIYLDAQRREDPHNLRLRLRAASEEQIARIVCLRNGHDALIITPNNDPRVIEEEVALSPLAPDEYCYVRVETCGGNMAWGSPWWGD